MTLGPSSETVKLSCIFSDQKYPDPNHPQETLPSPLVALSSTHLLPTHISLFISLPSSNTPPNINTYCNHSVATMAIALSRGIHGNTELSTTISYLHLGSDLSCNSCLLSIKSHHTHRTTTRYQPQDPFHQPYPSPSLSSLQYPQLRIATQHTSQTSGRVGCYVIKQK